MPITKNITIVPKKSIWRVLNPLPAYSSVAGYCLPDMFRLRLASFSLSSVTLYYPFVAKANVLVSRLGTYAQENYQSCQVGIYDSSNYRPYSRLGFGTLSFSGTGYQFATVSISLTEGELYWVALGSNSFSGTIAAGDSIVLLSNDVLGYSETGSVLPQYAGSSFSPILWAEDREWNIPAVFADFSYL